MWQRWWGSQGTSRYAESRCQYLRWIRIGISLIQEKQFIFWKQFSNIFRLSIFTLFFLQHLLLGQVIFEYILRPFIVYYCQQALFTLGVSLLLSLLNDASVDIVVEEDSFQFSPEAKFTLHLCVHVTLATDTEAKSPYNCYNVKNMLKLLPYKWFLNKLLLEAEWIEVMLISSQLNLLNLFLNSRFWYLNSNDSLAVLTSLEKLSLFLLQTSSW